MAEIDGPRLEPRGEAKRLVVFLHGYGADGNDLIDIGRAWQQFLPDAAFVSPHAPEPCAQAPERRCGLWQRDNTTTVRRRLRRAKAASDPRMRSLPSRSAAP